MMITLLVVLPCFSEALPNLSVFSQSLSSTSLDIFCSFLGGRRRSLTCHCLVAGLSDFRLLWSLCFLHALATKQCLNVGV